MSYNTEVRIEQGGDKLVVGSNGTIDIQGGSLSKQGTSPMQATFVVGTEATNVINVAVQLNDGEGNALTSAAAIPFYLAQDAAGLDPSTTAPNGGIAIGTDGGLIESVDNLSGLAISEADGDIDIDITDTGTPTFYLVLVNPLGELLISGAITFT